MADDNTPRDGDIDPNVVLPRHVREAAATANDFYKPADNSAVLPDATPAPHPGAEPQRTPEQLTAAVTPPAPDHAPAPAAGDTNVDWHQRFLSMQGRWKSQNVTIGQMQEQMTQLADELGRTQELLSRSGVQPQAPNNSQNPNHNSVNRDPKDVDTYGEELLDTMARTARAAIEPELQTLRKENDNLRKQQVTDGQSKLRDTLTRAVPNWRAVQNDPRWAAFLRLPNVYTSEVRGNMLKAAWDAANASQTIQVFKDFLNELIATGQPIPGTAPAAVTPPAHDPALNLADLAAPGRARPAGGDANLPADKPIYTRAQIAGHYADRRKGVYRGREADWNRLDADIIAAGNEGRIRG